MYLKENLGKNIRYYRKLNNWTQEYFADLIGIDYKNVSKIENGVNYPSPDTLTSIVRVFNIKFYELFIFEEEIPYDEFKEEIVNSLEDRDKIMLLYKTLKQLH